MVQLGEKPLISASGKGTSNAKLSILSLKRPPGSLFIPLLIIGFIGGVVGGLFSIFALNDYFSLSNNRSRQIVLEESSAIIETAKKLDPSVVSITTERADADIFGRLRGIRGGAGTGLIIRGDGLILTNKHVIPEGIDKITVISNDGTSFENARVLARDPLLDLAYIKVDANNLTAVELGDSEQVVVGQRVVAIGNALGEFKNTVTSGIISGIGRPVVADDAAEGEQLQDLLQTDAAVNQGNSGGALVNIEGKVIGITTVVAGGAENIAFAIPINQAKAGITSIETSGRIAKPYLGVRYVNLNKEIAQKNNLGVEQGTYLVGDETTPAILPDSPAAKAGLKQGDIITKVDGDEINKDQTLSELIGKHKVGDSLKLTIVREAKEQAISVTLSELPNRQ